ncbi:MAG: MFS transporter [Novosphingobium sp.]
MTVSTQSSPARTYYSFAILFVVGLLSYVDRSLLSVLQVPIKRELDLSDGQIGALTGLAFALVYSTAAIPLSRLVDRSSRRRVIALALLAWSLMTALSGFATSFAMLVICRMGLALGESACFPATLSLLSDMFKRNRRATAIAVIGMTAPLGTMIGMAAAGWLSEVSGWRTAFLWVGGLGIAIVPLALQLREPKRGAQDESPPQADDLRSFKTGLWEIWNCRASRYLLIGHALYSLAYCAMGTWSAPFYVRVFNMNLATVGLLIGTVFGIVGGGTALLSGWVADRLAGKTLTWYGLLPAIGALGAVPVGLGQFLAPTATISIFFAYFTTALMHLFIAPMNAALQTLTHPRSRGLVASLAGFLSSAVGYGLGPVGVGLMSDWLRTYMSEGDALRYALSLVLVGSLLGGISFLRACHYLRGKPA